MALAEQIGIRHEVLQTDELSIPGYQANQGNRCYFCKTELFVKVQQLAERLGVAVVCDGTNHDDHAEHRPGMRAGRERQVRCPLAECHLTKAEIRELAVAWELPIWDKPATPCLSSRIAYGETVTPERLAMVGGAERFLREQGFQPLRVRYHKGDMARIEVSPSALPRFFAPDFREEVVEKLKSLGFKFVSLDLEGFRSGSLNAVLAVESLTINALNRHVLITLRRDGLLSRAAEQFGEVIFSFGEISTAPSSPSMDSPQSAMRTWENARKTRSNLSIDC